MHQAVRPQVRERRNLAPCLPNDLKAVVVARAVHFIIVISKNPVRFVWEWPSSPAIQPPGTHKKLGTLAPKHDMRTPIASWFLRLFPSNPVSQSVSTLASQRWSWHSQKHAESGFSWRDTRCDDAA